MYKIIFYEGSKSVREFLKYFQKLLDESEKNKSSRIEYEKIRLYLDKLGTYGLSLKEPYLKHLRKQLWELRPMDNRLLLVSLDDNKLVVLSFFKKKTRRTPKSEIETAEREFVKYVKGRSKNER